MAYLHSLVRWLLLVKYLHTHFNDLGGARQFRDARPRVDSELDPLGKLDACGAAMMRWRWLRWCTRRLARECYVPLVAPPLPQLWPFAFQVALVRSLCCFSPHPNGTSAIFRALIHAGSGRSSDLAHWLVRQIEATTAVGVVVELTPTAYTIAVAPESLRATAVSVVSQTRRWARAARDHHIAIGCVYPVVANVDLDARGLAPLTATASAPTPASPTWHCNVILTSVHDAGVVVEAFFKARQREPSRPVPKAAANVVRKGAWCFA